MQINLMKMIYECDDGQHNFVIVEHESSDPAHSLQWAEEKVSMLLPDGAKLVTIYFVN